MPCGATAHCRMRPASCSSALLLLLQLACLGLVLLRLQDQPGSAGTCIRSNQLACDTSTAGFRLQQHSSTAAVQPWWSLPGAAAAAFEDTIMRAGGASSTLAGKMYNTGSNWTTFNYGWVADSNDPSLLVGAWDGPEQHKQWWMAKRPLQTMVTERNVASPDAGQPTVPFYASRGVNCPNLNELQGRMAQVYFQQQPGCDGSVWIPEGITIHSNGTWSWGDGPFASAAKTRLYRDNPDCEWYYIGTTAVDNAAARDLLHSLLLPGGSDITWSLEGPCKIQPLWAGWPDIPHSTYRDNFLGAWKAFTSPSAPGGLGPNAVYDGGVYPAPAKGDLYYEQNDGWDEGVPFKMQQLRFGWFNTEITLQQTTDAGWGGDDGPLWYLMPYCPNNDPNQPNPSWSVQDTCTLSVTPVQPDVFNAASAATRACAAALPQGIPFLTCRSGANGTLLHMDPATLANQPSINIVAGVDFFIGRADGDGNKAPTTLGVLPEVACNKQAFSPRFGGRCAAPVVQYLAYDEAYHITQDARFGLPQYGGCLAGGKLRNLTASGEWWTPPLWPVDAWHSLSPSELSDQQKMNSLFAYQDAFKLSDPVRKGPAGCFKMRLSYYAGRLLTTRCVQAPSDADMTTALNSGNWDALRLTHEPCDDSSAQQCFRIDDSLAQGTRITYRDLCIGLKSTPLPTSPGTFSDSVRLMPCTKGFTEWRQAAPGGWVVINHPSCSASPTPQLRECFLGWVFPVTVKINMRDMQIMDLREGGTVISSKHRTDGRAYYTVLEHSPVWGSYKALRKFWVDSFASSDVDIRAHRTRFIPPGGRQGPLARGSDGKIDPCESLADSSAQEACRYNARVKLASQEYTPDSCSAEWLYDTSLTGTSTTRGPLCYPGSTFLYTDINSCEDMSSDMRLSAAIDGGPPTDKCAAPVWQDGGQAVRADDFWSAVVSHDHDPCGWPFSECVADCSLPSDVASNSWTVAANGTVMDGGTPVGCTSGGCAASDMMQDPRLANQIAAIDWRNLTLYSPQLDFSAFRGAAGAAVWYLNLNFNMFGGNLTALDELPDIFPNLKHLGLAHCSAGRFAPEYSWQQAQMPYCLQGWANGAWTTGPNQACFCPEDSWSSMTVVPLVGNALLSARDGQTAAARQAGAVTGVTRMLYGSIPASWGRKPDGSLAAWSGKLLSVNLAGHHTITGDLPAEWYNQTAFPNLMYLKLKGTQIKPNFLPGTLKWKNPSPCNSVKWDDYSDKATEPYSVLTVSQDCTADACAQCDWWPLRSAAPWYYSPVNCRGSFVWSGCNSTCTGSVRLEQWTVTVPAANGGAACAYAAGYVRAIDATGCPTTPCPVNCEGAWSAWQGCTASCGEGLEFSTYSISVPPQNGGEACAYTNGASRNQTCSQWNSTCTPPADEGGSCNLTASGSYQLGPCDVCGTWAAVSGDNNTVTYAAVNSSRLAVYVLDPAIANNTCAMYENDTYTTACADAEYQACVGAWEWDTCNATCGGGWQQGRFNLTVPAAQCGTNCSMQNGSTAVQTCNTQPCPFNCSGNWTDWGVCNATCGGGNQSRLFVVSEDALHGGANCSAANQTEEWQACGLDPCPINCTGAWSDWGACNTTCGGGNQSRLFEVSQAAMHGGANCSYANQTQDWQACNTQPCPINCTGSWTDWDACNATCGGGNQSRVFVITQDAAHNGTVCDYTNDTVAWQACNTQPCPVDCVASWTDWSSCSVSCGGGNQSRVYQVVVQDAFAGVACAAANNTVAWQSCNTSPCPVNCTGNWLPWSACNATCGGGNQSRAFQVTTPAAHGGLDCAAGGGDTEWRSCNTQGCPASPSPQLGVCEIPELLPQLYLPRGTAAAAIPVLLDFPSPESKDLYCPYDAAAGASACSFELQASPVFLQAAAPTTPAVTLVLPCETVTVLTCQVVLPLGAGDAQYAVRLQPVSSSTTVCSQTLQLQPAVGQVILDSQPPSISSMQVTVPPTESPSFQCLVTFSEPVSWLANTTAGAGAAANDTAASSELSEPAATTTTAYTSSRLLLTNAALLNISRVPESVAVLASGDAANAASAFVLWFRSWGGAEAAVEVLGSAFQDIAGNLGQQGQQLSVSVPGTDLLARATSIASGATAISATASALSAAAAVGASSGAGGTTSLIRSVGHTQFLAMSVSLAVPWLPAEYLKLCAGLEWSNLAKPADAALRLATNSAATSYTPAQLTPSHHRRQLLSTDASSSGTHTDKAVSQWLDTNSRALRAPYVGSNDAARSSDAADVGTLVFHADSATGASNSSSLAADGGGADGAGALTNTLIITGTSRWPAAYTVRELQMTIIVLFAVVVAASLLQLLVVWLWKLFRLNADDLPNLVRFPKPQVVVYTLLMVPVLYGAAKLLASPTASRADWAAGVATIVVIPLPVLAFWAYVLIAWHRALAAAARGDLTRSKSQLLRAYGSGTVDANDPPPTRQQQQQQRAAATLALLGDDNPTLIIRDRRPGEEAFEQFADGGDEDDDEDEGSYAEGAGRGGSAAGQQRVVASTAGGRPWKAQGAPSSPRRPAAVSFLPFGGEQHQQGRPAPVSPGSYGGQGVSNARGGFDPAAAAAEDEGEQLPPLKRLQSLPGTADSDEEERYDGRGPLGEGVNSDSDYEDGDGSNGLAEAWQNARAAGQANSSWGGGQVAAGSSGGGGGAGGRAASGAGAAAASARPSGRFQLSLSSDGGGGQQQQPQHSASGAMQQLRKQDTWVSEAGAARAAAGLEPAALQEQQQTATRRAAATSFLAKHGFMVDDLVGDEHEAAVQRSQWRILLLHVISILQRCLTAVMFGLFHASYISATQLGLLITLHAGFITYLLAVRPYASWLLLLSDVLAYLCELTVLAVAVLLQRNPGYAQHQRMATALVTCYFFDVAAMVVPELLRYAAMAWAWVQARRARQQLAKDGQQLHQQQVQGAESEPEPEAGAASGVLVGQRSRRQPSKKKAVNASAAGRGVMAQADAEAAAAAALKLSGSGGNRQRR